jgi:predicted NBD/HSP70 family sugar kinase
MSTRTRVQSRTTANPADKRDRILRAVRETPGISKTELARRLRISPSTASALVSDLVGAGLVAVDGVGQSSGGRPPEQLVLNPTSPLMLAINLGETDVRLGLVNLHGRMLESGRARFQVSKGQVRLEPILDRAAKLAARSPHVVGAGIAVPGLIDRQRGVVRAAGNLGWFDLDIRAEAERRLGVPVEVDRHTNAGLLAEEWWGQDTAADPLLFVTAGSGIGVGIRLQGGLVEGATGVAGEFGHIPVEPDGIPCVCGRRGCLETVASSRALLDRYEALRGESTVSKPPRTVADVAAAAAAGDALARQALTEVAERLGLGLVTLISLLNPAAVIVGGELMDAETFVLPVVRDVVTRRAHAAAREAVAVRSSSFRDDASLFGAAALAFDALFQRVALNGA